MADVVIAPNQADANAAEEMTEAYAQKTGVLHGYVEQLINATQLGDVTQVQQARHVLVQWCEQVLLPQCGRVTQVLYPPVHASFSGRALVEALRIDVQQLQGFVQDLAQHNAEIPRMIANASAVRALYFTLQEKENDLLIPALLETPGVSLTQLKEDLEQHMQHNHTETVATEQHSGHNCSCGETDGPGFPELDARAIPHAIRHATIFGALETVQPGGGITLIAPHDPLPLLAQIDQRWPNRYVVNYVERGPEKWSLELIWKS